MKRLRGLLAHSPSLVISMLALVFALGSGAGYAAWGEATHARRSWPSSISRWAEAGPVTSGTRTTTGLST